jgi:hypothetical protein
LEHLRLDKLFRLLAGLCIEILSLNVKLTFTSWVERNNSYLARLRECVIDIEEDDSVLDRTLVKRWVY